MKELSLVVDLDLAIVFGLSNEVYDKIVREFCSHKRDDRSILPTHLSFNFSSK